MPPFTPQWWARRQHTAWGWAVLALFLVFALGFIAGAAIYGG